MGNVLNDLIPFGAFAMVSWIFYVIVDGLRRWHQQRILSQFQAKLLDRIGSVSELGAFVNTEAGDRFLKSVTGEALGPHVRILRATQSGTVLTVLGSALFIWNWLSPMLSDEAANATNAIATIILALGIGFLLSARLSYRLSKEMGLLDPDHRHASDRSLPAV